MRNIRKAVVTLAASGLAAFGAVAGTVGTASAATGMTVTGCSLGNSILTANVTPACTASPSTVLDPTSITVSADTSVLHDVAQIPGIDSILSLLGTSLGEDISYTLNCAVDGKTATYNGAFAADGSAAVATQTVSLASAVGSPEPGSCTVTDLTANSLLALNTELLTDLGTSLDSTLTFSVTATADTALPGAIWAQAGSTDKGVNADICADDTGNGNKNAVVQVYQCNSDLAQFWVYTSSDQIVHNGDCLDLYGSAVVLHACNAGSATQKWTVNGTDGHSGTIVNKSSSGCLTAPSVKDHAQFEVESCGKAGQSWIAPNQSGA